VTIRGIFAEGQCIRSRTDAIAQGTILDLDTIHRRIVESSHRPRKSEQGRADVHAQDLFGRYLSVLNEQLENGDELTRNSQFRRN
jgi:hypothetical protein